MVTAQTIKQVRSEYKEYLIQLHPDWADSTVSTHVSDAFYLYNNDIGDSFWKYFVSNETMGEAKQELREYLKSEVMSDRAEERSTAYYSELCMLKKFLDEKHGGVIQRIGSEFDAEIKMYDYSKQAYEGSITVEEAVKHLSEEVPYFGAVSYKLTVMLFAAMVKGNKYTRRANTEITMYFINRIGTDYGMTGMRNALQSTHDNIVYYYGQTGNKSNSMCRGCAKIAVKNNIDIKFDDSIFEGIIPKKMIDETLTDGQDTVRYWLYAAGDNSENWNSYYDEGIMAISWRGLGDFSTYSSKEEIRAKFQELNGSSSSYKNQVHAVWQFVNDIKVGDIIIVKRGITKIIGKGVVTGDFEYDENRYGHRNIRQVKWSDSGEWNYSGKLPQKMLTDITNYKDLIKTLLAFFDSSEEEENEDKEETFDSYTKDDFLGDVYISDRQYDTLRTLLLTKKNVILQGAPGVGKTYAAKRLAFSIMGEKDTNRVKMVQFHQSYSYEDFIMGFRPNESGFQLKKGVFYEFCKQAEVDDRPYFFIIDEINRGNLSKIFGELFMLIESDKRGVELQLLYADETFSIPSNVHIIGMMNTADRSLAMLDYALRRRFAFYDFVPAFDSDGFRNYRMKINNSKFNRLISCVESLNGIISADESLGDGFRIGHSYFCTKSPINDEWLNSVVEFELIPLLREYWFDEPLKVKDWSSNLRGAIK